MDIISKKSYAKAVAVLLAMALSATLSTAGAATAASLGAATSMTISGRVLAASSNGEKVPLQGILVQTGLAQPEQAALTDANGDYTLEVPYSAQVRLKASTLNRLFEGNLQYVEERAGFNQLDQSANGIWFHAEPVIAVVAPTAGSGVVADANIEFTRAEGFGTISGSLKNSAGGALKVLSSTPIAEPAQDPIVNVYDSQGVLQSQVMAKEGAYSVAEMPGTYYLSVGDESLTVEKQFYPSATEFAQATSVQVSSGQNTVGIDFVAQELALFPGSLEARLATGSNAIVGHKATVSVYTSVEPGSTLTIVWNHMTCPGDMSQSITWSDCTYEPIEGSEQSIENPAALAKFSYIFKSSDVGQVVGLAVTLHKTGFVSQTAYETVLRVSGPIKVISVPKIKGTVKVGQVVTAVLPRFNGIKPDRYEYYWLACDSALKAKTPSFATCTWVPGISSLPSKLKLAKNLKSKYLVLQIWSHNTAAWTGLVTVSSIAKVK